MVNPIRFQAPQPNALQFPHKRSSTLQEKPHTIFELPSWKTIRRVAGEFSASAWELAFRFGQSTTIHGVNRLFSRRAGKYERCVWFLTVLFALLGAIYVSHLLSKRFSEGKLETVVDSTRRPVYTIDFPSVTICNNNQLNWERIGEAKKRFLPADATLEMQENFEKIVSTFDKIRFGAFQSFMSLQNMSLGLLNDIHFTEVVKFMTWRCEEFLGLCVWNSFPKNCCEIFSLRRSENAFCWSFNTLETDEGREMHAKDPLWPWHLGAAGPGSGLQVRVFPNTDKHYTQNISEKGVHVMISDATVWHKEGMNAPINTQTIVEVEPVVYLFDNNTRGLGSHTRKCVFKDERQSRDFRTLQGHVYMIENCQSECHQQYLMKYCNCTLDLLFPPGPYPPCKTKDLICLAKNNEFFTYSHSEDEQKYVRNFHEGMVCECFRNCYSLNYLADIRPQFLSTEALGNQSFVDLDVHFRFETMMVYRTSLIFGWVDFMVAFGGIAGLFLGCSLISTMELAYFLLVDLPTFILQKYRSSKVNSAKEQQQSAIIMQQLQFKNNMNHLQQHLDMKSQLVQPQNYETLFYNNKMNSQLPQIEKWQTDLTKINYLPTK